MGVILIYTSEHTGAHYSRLELRHTPRMPPGQFLLWILNVRLPSSSALVTGGRSPHPVTAEQPRLRTGRAGTLLFAHNARSVRFFLALQAVTWTRSPAPHSLPIAELQPRAAKGDPVFHTGLWPSRSSR